jgi:hypothetical protein
MIKLSSGLPEPDEMLPYCKHIRIIWGLRFYVLANIAYKRETAELSLYRVFKDADNFSLGTPKYFLQRQHTDQSLKAGIPMTIVGAGVPVAAAAVAIAVARSLSYSCSAYVADPPGFSTLKTFLLTAVGSSRAEAFASAGLN